MSSFQFNFKTMNAYEIHKAIINTYVLKQPGDTRRLERDTSKDKTDVDVIRENHKFLWNEEPTTWEEKLSKRYYDKLFREYCICDLTLYKENKVALRWRTEQEVVSGRGQFTCGNKKCGSPESLRTWEVNFGYHENGEKRNALVKLRLCPTCSEKLNYKTKKREVKRLKKRKQKSPEKKTNKDVEESSTSSSTIQIEETAPTNDETLWSQPQNEVEKTREEEFEEYLEDLLF